MSVTKTNQFTKTWIVAESYASIVNLIALPELVATDPSVGVLTSTNITLQGSASGHQVQGNVDSVRKDLEELDDKSFTSSSFTATLKEKGNAQLNLTFNFVTRVISSTLTNTVVSTARSVFDSLLRAFPEQHGISQPELNAKADRLATLIKSAESLEITSTELQSTAKEIAALSTAAKKATEVATNAAEEADKQKKQTQTHQTQSSGFRQEAEKRLGEINVVQTQVTGVQATIQQQLKNMTTQEAAINEFFNRIEENKKKLAKSESTTSAITKKNSELQKQVDEYLIKAVGVGLFGAFEQRKNRLVVAKWIWAGCTVISVLIQAGIVIWLASAAKELGAQDNVAHLLSPIFLLKATAAIPVLFLIGFCVSQYSHERNHEETYAFKSALSFSLAPYLDLIKKMPEQATSDKYREFVVTTIGQVFSPPHLADENKEDKVHKMLGEVQGLLDSVGKFVERVKK